MKLLGTRPSEPVVKKGLTAIGSRLAALSKSSLLKSNTTFSADRGGGAVVTKIRALFKSLPEHGAGLGNTSEENGMLPGEEINSKWLALLTLEKACLSTVVLEGTHSYIRSQSIYLDLRYGLCLNSIYCKHLTFKTRQSHLN